MAEEEKSMVNREEEEDETLSESILIACRRLYDRNLLAAADGNVSIRLAHKIVITPSGRAKGFLKAHELAFLSHEGETLQGQPSGERDMHMVIYNKCPLAQAVVHAHPPHALAWSLARPDLSRLPDECLPEVILACGEIPIVSYARPTTKDLGKAIESYLPHHRALILGRHGAVTWGESLDEAVGAMERLEHVALILYLAEKLGGAKPLPDEEVSWLRNMRKQMGERVL